MSTIFFKSPGKLLGDFFIKYFFLLLLLTSVCKLSFGQQFNLKAIAQIDSFANGYPQEKIFLHTDRTIYVAGETIWFAAYVTLDNRQSFLSKVVYVNLTDEKGNIVEKKMLPLKNGKCEGDILLKGGLPQGYYTLSAYTLWMLNFPEFIYNKRISVRNNEGPKSPLLKSTDLFEVQFFPEGGDLINSVSNKVAFKALNKDGTPLDISGKILSKEQTVATFTSSHNGMGVFELTPLPGEQYEVIISNRKGESKRFNLPLPKDEGIAVKVLNESPSRLFVQVSRGLKNASAYDEVWIVAQINYEVVYSEKLNLAEDQTTAAISKKDLPAGIMQITIFRKDGVPLAERLAFINNISSEPNIIDITKIDTKARKRNSVSIDLSQYRNFKASASITNLSADSIFFSDNIVSSNYLTSDLKGYIHEPGFYFKDKDPFTQQALDLVMLTNGWRRFKWSEILTNNFPSLKYPVESGISIAGSLTKANGKTELKNGRVDFITKGDDSTTILTTAKLTNENEFLIPDLAFKKGATIYYQGTNEEKQNGLTNINIYPAYFDTLKKFAVLKMPPAGIDNNNVINELLSLKNASEAAEGKMLTGVTVRTKKLSATDSLTRLYATDIYQNSDQTIAMDGQNYYSVWQFLQRNIAGLEIGKDDAGQLTAHFSRYKNLPAFSSEEEAIEEDNTTSIKFFLNEVPVSKSTIEDISPSDIAIIKVWKGPAGYILGANRGAIGIYTQKGKTSFDWRKKGFSSFRKEGYSVTREFYNMDYDTPGDNGVKDIRPTLYWNGDLKPDKSGKYFINFYNDDISKSFKLVLNGIDDDGKLISIERVFQNGPN